ncbi:MAG: hypothetical protein HIU85_20380, partial [Proteobacteria bacterium]|nr:hypothetical protein [Pseudomonadota bacterium]
LGDPAPTRQAQLARARRLLSEGILSEQEIAGVLGWSVIEVRRAASERIDLQQESGDHE